MNNASYWVNETRPDFLHAHYKDLLSNAGFNVLGEASAMFDPYGYTCVWVLSESHLAVHTFPECSRTYVEITSCVESPFFAFMELETYERVEPGERGLENDRSGKAMYRV